MGVGQVFVTEIKLRATLIHTLAFTSLLLEELEGAGDFQHMYVLHVCAEVQLMLIEMKLARCISPNIMLNTYQRNFPAWWLCYLLHQTLLGNPSSAQWQNWSPVSEVIMEREGKKKEMPEEFCNIFTWKQSLATQKLLQEEGNLHYITISFNPVKLSAVVLFPSF